MSATANGRRTTATEERPTSSAMDVLYAIGKLRQDLTGYYGQLKAHDDLVRHYERQRERIRTLEELYSTEKARNAELKEQTRWMAQTDSRWEAAIRDLEQAKAENSELRDLVRGLMDCPVDLYHCETCEHAEVTPKSVTGNWDRYECKLKARAQELGAI